MENWKPLIDIEYKQIWDFVYENLSFQPNNEAALIKLPIPNKVYNISSFYNEGFDEKFYDDLHKIAIKCFKILSNNKNMYALNWQHQCFSFNPELPFEKDDFDEWLIPVFPNGDYLFFITNDLKNGVFSDGINLRISLFGKKMIELFDKYKPKIFVNCELLY